MKIESLGAGARLFAGWTYRFADPSFPEPVPVKITGVVAPTAQAQKVTNCCASVFAILNHALRLEGRVVPWDLDLFQLAMLSHGSFDPFGPVTAYVAAGIAVPLPPGTRPLPLGLEGPKQAMAPMIVQGWRERADQVSDSPTLRRLGYRKGHTFMVVDYDPATDRITTLEANDAFGLNGVGARQGEWTWRKLLCTYPHMRQAALV